MNKTPEKEEEIETPEKQQSSKETPKEITEAERLEELDEQIKLEKGKNLHLLADMENLRKRLHKEKMEMNRFAVDNLLAEVLLPLDNFENALGFTDNMSEETKNWVMGFEMILTQFKDILSHHNVKPIVSVGEHFDPHKHEAVEIEETDEFPDGTITQEFLKGYTSGDRILRPARVKVAKPTTKNKQEENKQEEE